MNTKIRSAGLVFVGVAVGLALAPATVNAAINYFDVTKTVTGLGSVSCPSGWKLTGGGVAALPNDYFGSINSTEYKLTGSFPSGSAWRATAKRTNGSYSSSTGWRFSTYSYTPNVYAICAT